MSSRVGCFSREKHVTKVSATCFHHLRRLRHYSADVHRGVPGDNRPRLCNVTNGLL